MVAGAGHNSLITACYLAKAGHSVLVLDARPIPGGGAATEEILLPGYRLDSCSTGHTIIQNNPLIADDELGLAVHARPALRRPRPGRRTCLPRRRAAHPLARRRRHHRGDRAVLQARDAEAYTRMLREWDEVKAVFGGSQHRPIGYGPSLDQELSEHPRGNIWKRRRVLSAWEVIRHEYESRHVRSYMLWQAYQTLVRPDSAGSGLLAYSVVALAAAAQLDHPGRRFRHADRRAGGVPGVVRRPRAVQPDRAPAGARGRPVRRRRDHRRRAVPRRHARWCRASTSSTCWTWRPRSRGARTGPTACETYEVGASGAGGLPGHDGAAAVRCRRCAALGGVGGNCRLARGRRPARPRHGRRRVDRRGAVAADRDADAGRPVARAGGPPHREAAASRSGWRLPDGDDWESAKRRRLDTLLDARAPQLPRPHRRHDPGVAT